MPLPVTASENDELVSKLEMFSLDTGIQYFWLGAETDANGDGFSQLILEPILYGRSLVNHEKKSMEASR